MEIIRLKELLDYDPATGNLRWKKQRGQRFLIGMVAGNKRKDGYIRIMVDGHRYMAHVLIWAYMTGQWPEKQIDHKDLDRSNNRWSNLRLATTSQQQANIGLRKDNKSGTKGVRPYIDNRYRAQFRRKHLGLFSTYEEAVVAYETAATNYSGEYARIR